MKLLNTTTGMIEYIGSYHAFIGIESYKNKDADYDFEIIFDDGEEFLHIEDYVYSFYPEKQQSQDGVWEKSFSTKLKAAGVENLESVIVGSIAQLSNKTIAAVATSIVAGLGDAVLANIQGNTKTARKNYATQMLAKLIKIAIKTEWAESCIIEGKTAIAKNREPVFPPFPEL